MHQMSFTIIEPTTEFVRRQTISDAETQPMTKNDGYVRGIYGLLPPRGE